MSRRAAVGLAAAALALATLAVALLVPSGSARGSALSKGPGGWMAARRYLEARGVAVTLLDRPLAEVEARGVLVLTFPWQQGLDVEIGTRLDEHLRRGGDVVLAYSGEAPGVGELLALDGLGLEAEERRRPPLAPAAFRRFVRQEWALRPLRPPARPVRVWAPRYTPEGAPDGAEVLFAGPAGEPVVVAFRRYRGRVVTLPADAFANARLGEPGNADLLETLIRRLGDEWTLDELHHGLVAPRSASAARLSGVFDLVAVHLLVLYLLALLALARRFGPAWTEGPRTIGSTGSFLLGLGELHHRLGHHREAAALLLARARELDRTLAVPAALERRAADAGPEDLVEIARAVARLRRGEPAHGRSQP